MTVPGPSRERVVVDGRRRHRRPGPSRKLPLLVVGREEPLDPAGAARVVAADPVEVGGARLRAGSISRAVEEDGFARRVEVAFMTDPRRCRALLS